jgi:hypothetical protein
MKLDYNVSVNSLISMSSKCNRVDIAASAFDNLKGKTYVTWNAMILGRTNMDRNVFVATALVDMYAKCGAIEIVREL